MRDSYGNSTCPKILGKVITHPKVAKAVPVESEHSRARKYCFKELRLNSAHPCANTEANTSCVSKELRLNPAHPCTNIEANTSCVSKELRLNSAHPCANTEANTSCASKTVPAEHGHSVVDLRGLWKAK